MEKDNDTSLREHLDEVLQGKSAHILLEAALSDFPLEQINSRPDGSPHTAWQLVEHIRLAQWDILEFSRNADHVSPDFPDGYWPDADGTAEGWRDSVHQILNDLREISDLVTKKETDLFAKIPHGDGQTILREALVVADHNAYHLGQLVMLKKMFSQTVG